MILMFTCSWQPETANDVYECWQETIKKLPIPDYMTEHGPYWYADSGIGHAFALYEVDRSKLADAIDHLSTTSRMYGNIPGFKREVKVCMEHEDVIRNAPPT